MLTKYAFYFWLSVFLLLAPLLVQGQEVRGRKSIRITKTTSVNAASGVDDDFDVKRIEKLKATLVEHGVEPNQKSIEQYLRSLIPDKETVSETRKWVQRLKDSSYDIRKEASRKLINMPVITMELIQEMLDDPDLEVSFRAREIHQSRSRRVKTVRLAIFEYLSASKAPSITPTLMQVYSQLDDQSVIRAATLVIKETSDKNDLPVLIKTANGFEKDEQLAIGCLSAISRLDKDQALKWILSQRKNLKNDSFKLYCADSLARNKKKECLAMYVGLLGAQQDRCRYRAFRALNGMTEQSLGYVVSKGSDQAAAIARWNDYVLEKGDKIEIDYQSGRIRLGRLLVCSYTQGRISSYDENGKLMWTTTGKNPFTCQGLPNGNCLVMFYTIGKMVEYDETGKVVKEFTGLPKNSSGLQRLDNGHTLLASGQAGSKICEIDENGKQVWSITVDGTPTGARLLENGLILAALYAKNQLVEVDRNGKIKKEIKINGKPYTAQKIENGNYLVAFAQGGIAEYTDTGKELWRAKTDSNTYWADENEDGTFTTADKTGILKISKGGKVISRDSKHTNITYISAY